MLSERLKRFKILDSYYSIEIHENIMKKAIKKKITIENLATIVNKGFSDAYTKMNKGFSYIHEEIEDLAMMAGRGFEDVDKTLGDLEEKISRKIDGLSNRIDDLSLNRATREELKILSIRVERVEKKVLKYNGAPN